MNSISVGLLENDKPFLNLLRIGLEDHFALFATSDTEEFIEKVKQPAVIIMDMHLDNETGIEVMRRVRKKEKLCHVIYISATASKQTVKDAMNEGWGGFFLEKDDADFWVELERRVWEAKALLKEKITVIQQAYALSKNIEEDLKKLITK